MMRRLALRSPCLAALLALGCSVSGVAPQPPTGPRPPSTAAEAAAARHFDTIRQDPPALRAFLRAFPKGADLHTHLTGAVYAESLIRWAADMPLCIDLPTFAFVNAQEGGGAVTCRDSATQRPASDALIDPTLYRSLIDAFSTRFWHPARTAGHYQFFDSFRKFGTATREGREASPVFTARAIAEVVERAALQNVLHVELLMSFGAPAGDLSDADQAWAEDAHLAAARQQVLANGLREQVSQRRAWLDAVERETRAMLRCGRADAMRGCGVSLKYMPYALRGLPPEQVFAQALLGFELGATDDRIAGVNLVMPEDWYIAMRDYDLHMRMYGFLRRQYPGVNVALHAGELALGLVPPETLGLHVRQAIGPGGAQRIGHGTDVMYDADPAELLRQMADRRIAVEISLSSSDLILGLRGARHPLRQFLRAGVPVVIATDDEGVARSDLTNEYQRAVEEQGLNYREIKAISRNSLEFSFLPAGRKADLRQQLEVALAAFEASHR